MLYGDSSKTVNSYSQFNPNYKADLIYIDGSIYIDAISILI